MYVDYDPDYDEYEYRKEIEEMDKNNREAAKIHKRYANNITAVENGLEAEDGEPIRIN